MRFVDLSGYGFSGKHAFIDLMREMEGYHVPHFTFEFQLLRAPGGILDLHDAIVNDWSLVRSDAAVRRFRRLVRRVGTKHRLRRPSTILAASGDNYDDHFDGHFFPLADAYLSRITRASWRADWPFAAVDMGDIEYAARKILRRLGYKKALDVDVWLTAPAEDFIPATRDFLRRLLTANVSQHTTGVVMHNAFEPYNPYRSLIFFEDVRSIVVDRDPRDMFVQQLEHRPMAVGPKEFVERFRAQHEAARRFEIDDSRVLRLTFEDLVLDYDATVARVLAHLDEPPESHRLSRQYFVPEVSARNVGLWRTYGEPDHIRIIEKELGAYCRA